MVVSSTSMNVGTTTAIAMTQGLNWRLEAVPSVIVLILQESSIEKDPGVFVPHRVPGVAPCSRRKALSKVPRRECLFPDRNLPVRYARVAAGLPSQSFQLHSEQGAKPESNLYHM